MNKPAALVRLEEELGPRPKAVCQQNQRGSVAQTSHPAPQMSTGPPPKFRCLRAHAKARAVIDVDSDSEVADMSVEPGSAQTREAAQWLSGCHRPLLLRLLLTRIIYKFSAAVSADVMGMMAAVRQSHDLPADAQCRVFLLAHRGFAATAIQAASS